jgi:hypothetical protein
MLGHQLNNPRKEEILKLCHQLAEVSPCPLSVALGEFLSLTALMQRVLPDGPH